MMGSDADAGREAEVAGRAATLAGAAFVPRTRAPTRAPAKTAIATISSTPTPSAIPRPVLRGGSGADDATAAGAADGRWLGMAALGANEDGGRGGGAVR